mmetsp:Transcript_23136/g.39550  ORF Transcript_23136/g.39550 Transcript_23136/m.39550 type:complete len:81 (-) Transcript_23136:112-354(-)
MGVMLLGFYLLGEESFPIPAQYLYRYSWFGWNHHWDLRSRRQPPPITHVAKYRIAAADHKTIDPSRIACSLLIPLSLFST